MSNPFGVPDEFAHSREWFRVENSAQTDDGPSSADVYIYDAIGGFFGVPASDFVAAIAGLDVDLINLYVNSPGGDVFDAIAMKNTLARHPAKVVAHVDGLAASAASFLITAADEVVMGQNSELMIHDALALQIGNAKDMQDTADNLNRTSQNIAAMYAAKAGGDPDEWRALMLDETWFSADEAVKAGLADSVAKPPKKAAKAAPSNRFDLSMFNHAGRSDAPDPRFPNATATLRPAALLTGREHESPDGPGVTQVESEAPVPTLNEGLRDLLGVPADAETDDDALLARAADSLNARPTQFTPPEGTSLIDSATLADLRSAAEDGRAARAEQVAARRASIVENAINEGRIPVARRDHWIAQLNADEEGAVQTLNSLEPNTIPLAPVGFTGGVDEHSDEFKNEDAAFKKFAAQMGLGVEA